MIPVDQRVLDHRPEEGRYGDCFRAAVASILELPYELVPHVMAYPADAPLVKLPDGQEASRWYAEMHTWLAARGMGILNFDLKPLRESEGGVMPFLRALTMYHDLGGPSPRYPGVLHSVVARAGVIVHDPHPDRSGFDVPMHRGGARMSATLQPTATQWKRIEEALLSAYGSVDLEVDDYALRLEVRRVAPLRYEIVPFVNGWLKGEWIQNDCEERRRFLRPVILRLWSALKIAKFTKGLSARKAEAYIKKFNLDASSTYYMSSWCSPRALKRHLVKHNTSIRLVAIHGQAEPQP